MIVTWEYAVQSLASVIGFGIAGVTVRGVLVFITRRRHDPGKKVSRI